MGKQVFIEEVYVWQAWNCPECEGINDYDHTKEVGSLEHECIHCEIKVEIRK